MFLLPMFPDDILCSIAGIMPITYSVFIFMQLITRFTSIGGTLLFRDNGPSSENPISNDTNVTSLRVHTYKSLKDKLDY